MTIQPAIGEQRDVVGVQGECDVLIFGVVSDWIFRYGHHGLPGQPIPVSPMWAGAVLDLVRFGRTSREDLGNNIVVAHTVGAHQSLDPDESVGHCDEHSLIPLVNGPLAYSFTFPGQAKIVVRGVRKYDFLGEQRDVSVRGRRGLLSVHVRQGSGLAHKVQNGLVLLWNPRTPAHEDAEIPT